MTTVFCDFTYVANEAGGYHATCGICGREVKTKTTKAIASCRSNPKPHAPREVMQVAGMVQAKPPVVGGPGTELKAILKKWLGIEPAAGCSCNSMAARMDALGPDWCEGEVGMTEIIGVMREEARKRSLPFFDAAGRMLVRRAIRNAKRAAGRDGQNAANAGKNPR